MKKPVRSRIGCEKKKVNDHIDRLPCVYCCKGAVIFMCRRSLMCGAALAALGVGLVLAAALESTALEVLLGIALIICGAAVARMR